MSRKAENVGLVSALGVSFELIKALVDEVKTAGGTEQDVRRILSEKDIRKKLAQILVGKPEWVWTGFVVINHKWPLCERIAMGGYGMIFSQFSKIYPGNLRRDGSDEVELALVQFNRPTTLEDAFSEISRLGFRPAGVEELVALGDQHREVAFKYHVLAFADSKNSEGVYFEVPSLSWSVPGDTTLSTWQFTPEVGDGVAILCVKNIKPIKEPFKRP